MATYSHELAGVVRKASPTNQLILCPLLCLLSYSIHGGNDTEWKKENLKWIIPELDVNLLVADVVLEVYAN